MGANLVGATGERAGFEDSGAIGVAAEDSCQRQGQSRVLSLFSVYFFRLWQCWFDPDELGSVQVGDQILLMVLLSVPDIYPVKITLAGVMRQNGGTESFPGFGAVGSWLGCGEAGEYEPSAGLGCFQVGSQVGRLAR